MGLWLGWAAFWAFGYAGYVFPLLLILYGAGAFVRAPLARGWPGLAGLVLLLVSATGHARPRLRHACRAAHSQGRYARLAVDEALSVSIGTVGTWIILLAILPVAALFITQASLRTLGAAIQARWSAWRAPRRVPAPPAGQQAKGEAVRDTPDLEPRSRPSARSLPLR